MGSLILRYEYTATDSGLTFVEGQSSPIDIGTVGLTPHTITGGSPPLTSISNVSIAITSGSGDLSFNLTGTAFSLVGNTLYENGSTYGTLTHSTGVLNIAFGPIISLDQPHELDDLHGNIPWTLTDLATLLSQIEYSNSSNAPGTSATIQFTFSGSYVYNQPSVVIEIAETDTLPTFTSAGAALGSISAGTTSASFAVSSFRPPITDADGPLTGIAITSTATASAGAWQYSTDNGQNWTAVGTVSGSSALVLRDTDLLRFVGSGQAAADASFTYRPWDQYGASAGSKVDAAGNFGIGTASSATTAILHLQDLNDAPVLAPASPVLTAITEDNIGNTGQTVASFLGSSIADSDAGAQKGIAITALVEANGHWQYSLDGGATWTTIDAVSTASALLLRDTDRVRFNPDGLNGTDASLTYRAWDQTSGAAGTKVGVGSGGGTSAFSTASNTATLHDASVNDLATVVVAPVSAVESDVIGLGLFYVADKVTITDPDIGDPAGVKYVAGSASVSASGPTPPSGALTDYILVDGATGAVAYDRAAFHWLAAGQSAVYTITFQVHPGNEAAHQEALTFTISGANDAPVLAPIHPVMAPITENASNPAGQTVASFRAPILDNDPGALTGIAITATAGNGNWQYSIDNGASWHTFVGSTASALLLADTDLVRFAPDQNNGGQASFTYRAWDQTTGTHGGTADTSVTGGASAFSRASDSVTLAVASINDAPVLTPAHQVLSPITEDAVANGGLSVASIIGITVSDVDSGVQGIALSGLTGNNGHWEYSFDGTHWSTVGAVSESAALLLQADDFLRFAPDGKNGTSASLTYHAWDRTGGTHGNAVDLSAPGATGGTTAYSTATDTASLAVSDVNDAPVVAGPVTLGAIAEGSGARLITQAELLGQTSDVDQGHTLTAAHLAIATGQGTLTDNHDGTWNYTPVAHDETAVSFTFDVSDGIAPAIQTSATLDIAGINDAPVAQSAVAGGNEDTPIAGTLVATDIDGPALTFSRVAQAAHGSVTINTDGSYVYTPDANYHGPDSFSFKANDGTLDSNIATVNLTIASVNDAPVVAGSVALSPIAEDSGARLITQAELLGQTSDVDQGHVLTAANLAIATGQGTLVDNHDGTWSYTPAAHDDTAVSFTFDVGDGIAPAIPTSATLDITGVNDAPVAQDAMAGGNEDTAISGTLVATDIDGPALTFSRVTQAAHGSVTINTDGSYIYTPDANYHGPDSFTFKVSDGTLDSNIATVTLTVASVNDAPVVAGPVTLGAIAEGSPARLITQAELLGRTTDADGDPLTAANLAIATGQGTLTDNHDGTWSYTPVAHDETAVSFTFDVGDGIAPAIPTSATLDITGVNDAPVAQSAVAGGDEDTPIAGSLVATDIDGPALTFSRVAQAAHGSVSIAADGSYVYTPDANYHGPDSFTFKANDGTLDSNIATVTLTIAPVNDAPVVDGPVTLSAIAEDSGARLITQAQLLGRTTDIDGDLLTAANLALASGHGVLIDNHNGTWSFTPAPNDDTAVSFSFDVSDGIAPAVATSATLDITPVNDAPVAHGGAASGDENTVITGALNATDVDNVSLSFIQVGQAAHGSVSIGADGTFAYTPSYNYHGTDSFTYRVNDGTLDSNTATVDLTVNFSAATQRTAARNDFDASGHSSILWQNTDGTTAVWSMNGLSVTSGANIAFNPGAAWHAIGTGDFNGDGKSDILWQNADGTPAVWLMNGQQVMSGANVGFNPGAAWHEIAAADFNGDGKADILWQNNDGQAAVWLMDGLNVLGGANVGFNPGAAWHAIGAGDFDGDGKADILWQNNNGQAAVWLMNGLNVLSGANVGSNPGAAWHVEGAGDFNGDGKADILWQNQNGQAAIWQMDGLTVTAGANVGFNPGPAWQVHGSGDFNGDGKADIILQNTDGTPAVWLMDGFNVVSGGNVGFNPGASWQVIPQHHDLFT